MALALCLTISFASCSDDEGGSTPAPSLPTPAYESVSGLYDVTTAGSPYESIELGASGNYIVTLNPDGYMKSAPATSRTSLLRHRTPQTRAAQSGNIIYGTFRNVLYDCTNTFTYDDDGHLVKMDDGRNNRDYVLTWTDGNLTRVDWTSRDDGYSQVYAFNYGSQPNADNLMFYYFVYDVDIDEIQYLYYAGLLGRSTTHLPESIYDPWKDSTTAITWTDSYMYVGNDPEPSMDYVHPFSFYD